MNAPANIPTLGDADDAFRAAHVGASEVAALFNASPYLTHFELWHRKNGTVATPGFGGNERIEFGIRLEPVILDAAADRWGYERLKTPTRLDNGKGLGGHPDQLVNCPERGFGILEVKTADWLIAKKWGDEPPLHYLLQAQTYMGLAGVGWGDVVVLVGGNELRRYQYEFRPTLFAEIEQRVAAFWRSIETAAPPKADYTRDGDTIGALYDDPADTVIDLRLDNRAAHLAAEFLSAKARAKAADADAEAARAELLEKIGNNGAALIEGFRIGCAMTRGSPDREITAAMVGEVIKGRRGYRRFDVKEKA